MTTRPGWRPTVSVQSSRRGGATTPVVVRVIDGDAAKTTDEIAHFFERFLRERHPGTTWTITAVEEVEER
jgi:hypothetical protein